MELMSGGMIIVVLSGREMVVDASEGGVTVSPEVKEIERFPVGKPVVEEITTPVVDTRDETVEESIVDDVDGETQPEAPGIPQGIED